MRHTWDELTESIYRAAVDASAWPDIMALMRTRFGTRAETLYFLDFGPQRMRPIYLSGISERALRSFDEAYFTADNPWLTYSRVLHRPGIIRTNERLARYARDPSILYRSTLYNEWMRPEGLRYGLATTLMAGDGTVANITLIRSRDMPGFGAHEVRAFARASHHLARALHVAVRLEGAEDLHRRSCGAFDALAQGVLIIDRQGALRYANRAAEQRLRKGDGLTIRGGALRTAVAQEQEKLDALLRGVLSPNGLGGMESGETLDLERGVQAGVVRVGAIPISGAHPFYLATCGAALLTIAAPNEPSDRTGERLQRDYALTRTETRLALALAGGLSLRHAAQRMGITYTTARGYLKVLFRKTETHRQAQLVALVLREPSP